MFMDIINLVLALFGVGLLIFIHELGHYIVARRVGMRIEVFSIGLGKPFKVWTFQGVKWQVCYLPFGGYVKIAGEKEEKTSLIKEISDDTFYGKKPFDRIKVALAGPIVNIAFAFMIFTAIWMLGGRSEPFSRHTKIIGLVDPKSETFSEGIRPGDEITSYNGKAIYSFKDLLIHSVMRQKNVTIGVEKINYLTGEQTPFHLGVTPYVDPRIGSGEFTTTGILSPASLLIYQPEASGDFSLEQSPMKDSGIMPGDRIIWASDELLFSSAQLNKIVNEQKILVTVERNGRYFLAKVPRISVADLRLSKEQKGELEDWQHQLHLKKALKECYYLPYSIDRQGIVRSTVSYLDNEANLCNVFDDPEHQYLLNTGDKIVAVAGRKVFSGYDILDAFQTKTIQLIVQRGFSTKDLTSSNQDEKLIHAFDGADLKKAIDEVKLLKGKGHYGSLYVLKATEPVLLSDLTLQKDKKDWLTKQTTAQQEKIDKIKNQQQRHQAQRLFDKEKQKLVLGLPLSDAVVKYNPTPLRMFTEIVSETFYTLKLLVTGQVHPKWMSGPIGMVQMIHQGWSSGLKEGLYWIGMISLNLGIFNLLPLPVLDGGHIGFALFEMISRRKLSAKVMEKLIMPFMGLLLLLFVYITFQDLKRLFLTFLK